MKVNIYFNLAALAFLSACASQTQAPPIPRPQAVRVVLPRQGPILEGRDYLGEVAPTRTIRLLAQVAGSVAALPLPEGATASAGQVLVRLAAPETVARRARIKSERRRAENERDFVCTRLETDRRLAAAGDIAPEQLEASEKQCRTARLAARSARASEREARAITAKSVARAPFDGQVLQQLVDVGQTVMPGTPLLVFGSQDRELVMRVPQSDLDRGVHAGATVTYPGGRGTILRLGAMAQGPGRTVTAHVPLDVSSAPLPVSGSLLSLRLVVDERLDASAVPLEAVGQDANGHYLLRLDGDRVQRVEVALGPRQDGWVAVEPRLEPDRPVVVNTLSLSSGTPVLAVEVQP